MTAKFPTVFGIVLAGFQFSAAAGSAGAVEVDIKFSQHLAKAMPRINVIERQREKYFRQHRRTPSTSIKSTRMFATSRWSAVQWANEVLIPDVNDFSVEALTRGFVTASLERAGISGVERVEIELRSLHVANYSLAKISGRSSYAIGSITAYAAAGKVIGTADLTANLVADFLTASRYEGPDFAFPDTSKQQRVGPTLAYFVYKALGKIFPDRELPRTVLLIF